MKMWNAYASEHSMNLVMIGKFKRVQDADECKRLLDELSAQVAKEQETYLQDLEAHEQRFSETMLQLLNESRFYTLRPTDLEQFLYTIHVSVQGDSIRITTDESDISAFLKVLIDMAARVEIYSAHDYPENDKESKELVE